MKARIRVFYWSTDVIDVEYYDGPAISKDELIERFGLNCKSVYHFTIKILEE